MAISSRFPVGVHILALLAQSPDRPVTSDYLAGSASTNPAVVRKLLQALGTARLTRAQLGAGGGSLLARPAETITLLDVYHAVDEGELFALHHAPPNPACGTGRHILAALKGPMDRAEAALEAELAATTIADVVRDVLAGQPACEA